MLLEEPRRSEPSPSSGNGQTANKLSSYHLSERQSLVVDERSWSNDILYGGAKGGGKSFLFRYLFCIWTKMAPGMLCYLFRREYEELWKNHMEGPDSFPVMLQDEIRARRCAIVGKQIRWHHGARIFLNHMQLEKHKYKYQGVEMHAAAFDEATAFTETQIRYVLMSVRFGSWRPPPALGHMVGRLPIWLFGANPGGVGHDFIKGRYVDLGPYRIVKGDEQGEGGTFRQFIPARAEDNPELLRNDPLYLERLEIGGDPVLIKAMREGDWTAVFGSMFGEAWHPQRLGTDGRVTEWHVMEPKAIPLGWPLWRGGDDGFANPSAVYWLTRDPDKGTIYVVSEIYAAGLTAPELGEKVLDRDRRIPMIDLKERKLVLNQERLRGDYDANAFQETGRTNEISRGDQMNRMGCGWRPVAKWPGSRVARVKEFHRLLRPNPKEGGRRPGIVFFSNCVNAIRTIPKIMRDEADREDVSDNSELHAWDGVTYGVQHKGLKAGTATLGI